MDNSGVADEGKPPTPRAIERSSASLVGNGATEARNG